MTAQVRHQTPPRVIIRQVIGKILLYALMIFLTIITLGPFLMMISASLQNMTYLTFPFDFIPKEIFLNNYVILFGQTLMGRWTFNSVVITVGTTGLQLITCSMAGYAFARGNFPGRDILFWIFMGTLMLPETITVVPLFILLAKLGWVNTYTGLILPHATTVFGVFLLRQYFLTIPRDYDDAVLMDGGSRWHIFWHVMLPLSKPALATLATLTFLGTWNAFMYPLVMTTSGDMRPLTVGLATMVVQRGQAGMQMAGAVVVFLPTFIFFMIMQRYVVQGISLTGLKG
ncbi:MAG: carbohydrate ABC transporter permease [Chloroflexi bacterium]|nr:MAG: carbohydrate ABC transporter permease [Chloroflexota bacterium]